MSRKCREIDRFLGRLETGEVEADDSAWQTHRERCSSCRSQWTVESELRSCFAQVPPPTLSPYFGRQLQRRLDLEPSRRTPMVVRRFVLPAYWLAACLASCLILGRIGGHAGAAPWIWASVIALVPLAFSPLAALTRRLGLDLLDLVFLSVE